MINHQLISVTRDTWLSCDSSYCVYVIEDQDLSKTIERSAEMSVSKVRSKVLYFTVVWLVLLAATLA